MTTLRLAAFGSLHFQSHLFVRFIFINFLFRLFPLEVTTTHHPFPSPHVLCILLSRSPPACPPSPHPYSTFLLLDNSIFKHQLSVYPTSLLRRRPKLLYLDSLRFFSKPSIQGCPFNTLIPNSVYSRLSRRKSP